MRRNGFDRLARPYRWMEYLTFGTALQNCRTCFLPEMQRVQRVLVLGDGDGRFTQALLCVANAAKVMAIDASGAMLEQMRRRCHGDAERLRTHQAVLPAGMSGLVEGESCDLVATHFFLDCLTTNEVDALAQEIRQVMADDGVWAISDFAVPEGVMRLPSALIVGVLYRAFRLLTGLRTQQLPRHAEALRRHGFKLAARQTRLGGLLIAELWRPVIESEAAL